MTASVVQQVSGTGASGLALSNIEFSSTSGNTILVLAGWNLGAGSSAPMPAVYPQDSANNYYVHLGTSANTNTSSRCTAWVCTNARAVSWVSVSPTVYASTLSYLVVELSGMPTLTAVDISATSTSASGSSSLSFSQTASVTDVAFVMAAVNSASVTVTTPPSGWTALTTVTAGSSPYGMRIFPYWKSSAAAGTVSASYTFSASRPLSGLLVAVQQSPAAPAQPNPNFPVTVVEAGFGFTPGDPSASPPSWTDITAWTLGKEGDQIWSFEYGRAYELATPEAGTLTVGIRNNTGAFTPGNSTSPFYPHVVLGTPIRVRAYWSGVWYQVAYGYVEAWPQEWPDMPQWGLSKMTATDAIAVLNASTMPSALQGEVLSDAPYAYFPCNEQYFTFSSGISSSGSLGSYSQSDAGGLLCANASRTSQRTATYIDGVPSGGGAGVGIPAETGFALNLIGDQGTGFGTTGYTSGSAPQGGVAGPGMLYIDPGLPSPGAGNGVSVEFWFIQSDTHQSPTLLAAYRAPFSYSNPISSGPISPAGFTAQFDAAGPNLTLTYADGATSATLGTYRASTNAQHLILAYTRSGGTTSLTVYLNGTSVYTDSAVTSVTPWQALTAGLPAYVPGFADHLGNYTAAHVAAYPYGLPAARAASHYTCGTTGFSGDPPQRRFGRIMCWSGLGLPHGAPGTLNGSQPDVQIGPAYDVGGSSAADAINAVAAADGGLLVAMPSGVTTYINRWWLNNIASSATFGDSIAGGEVPYLPGQSFGYDNTYLHNQEQTTRQNGATQSVTAYARDASSASSYFLRAPQTFTIETNSDLDAWDDVNWDLALYSQPSLRVKSLTVDASSNPSVAFPVVLATKVGDVTTVNRRPVGGAAVSTLVQIQKIAHRSGPATWQTSYQMSPYAPQNAILTLDVAGLDVAGNNSLGR